MKQPREGQVWLRTVKTVHSPTALEQECHERNFESFVLMKLLSRIRRPCLLVKYFWFCSLENPILFLILIRSC